MYSKLCGSIEGSSCASSRNLLVFVMENAEVLNSAVVHARDFCFNIDDFEILRCKLSKVDGDVIERPQHLFMRIAVSMHLGNVNKVIETYDVLSRRYSKVQSAQLFESESWGNNIIMCMDAPLK